MEKASATYVVALLLLLSSQLCLGQEVTGAAALAQPTAEPVILTPASLEVDSIPPSPMQTASIAPATAVLELPSPDNSTVEAASVLPEASAANTTDAPELLATASATAEDSAASPVPGVVGEPRAITRAEYAQSLVAMTIQQAQANGSVTAMNTAPSLYATILSEHNRYRSRHGSAALAWDTTLASAAQAWSNRCNMQHGSSGENLFWTSVKDIPSALNGAIQGWYNEVGVYDYNNPNWQPAAGHFTQVVWRSSASLGCGATICSDGTYVTCRYSPPGNFLGEFQNNVFPPTSVPPPAPTGGTITTGLSTAKCLDAPNFNSGTQLTLWDCHGRNNQRWELLADGSLRIPGTNKCLDVRSAGTADGTVVQVWDCNGTPAQKWFYDAQRRLHPYAAPRKCLNVPGGNTANGVGLDIWECGTGSNHVWASTTSGLLPSMPAFAANSRIQSLLNNLCLDVSGNNFANQNPIVMWQCGTQNNQRWVFANTGQLRSSNTASGNKCIHAQSTTDGSAVFIFDCNTGLNQRWFIDRLNRLRPYHAPNMCLDIAGANSAAGTRVQLWSCVDVPQQRWRMI